MNRKVKILVAEPSVILRNGIISLLKQMDTLHLEVTEVAEMDTLRNSLNWQKPDILIINPASMGMFPLQQIRKENPNASMKCVALLTSFTDNSALKNYDESLSLYDSAEQIMAKVNRIVHEPETDKRHESLSQREKEVIVCVIEGMTNKQIADKLCLSAHTVITHRRNISAKLDIHSTAGLTIYAIVNKLVELDDIKDTEIP